MSAETKRYYFEASPGDPGLLCIFDRRQKRGRGYPENALAVCRSLDVATLVTVALNTWDRTQALIADAQTASGRPQGGTFDV